tara:strand:+ start:557 stop:1093 length:537 start_codon:yes stop_codon:yes gene_type:complete
MRHKKKQEKNGVKMAKNDHGLNEKQLLFANTYLNNGRNASAAYRAAYGDNLPEAHVNSSSSRLLRHVKVREYLVKVRQQNAEITQRKQDIDRDFLIQEYLDILKLSKDNLQLNTAKNTLDSLAHLAGLWLDKREITNNVKVDMTLEQLDTNQLIDALQLARHDAIDAPYKLIDDEKPS